MLKKILKITLIVILVIIFGRAIWLMTGLASEDDITGSKIAVIDFNGEIFSSKSFIKKMEKLNKKDAVKGFIIRVNSPGGAVAPSMEIYNYLLTIKKPLYASMGTVAASGGYLVSLAANKIYALPSSITGSIGVIMNSMNTEELYGKIGISPVVIKSGKFKDAGNPGRKMTEEEREILTAVVMDMYNQFTAIVAERRKLEMEEVLAAADGRIITGKMALEQKLVDSLGTWRDAYEDMKKTLNISDLEVYEPEDEKSWFEKITDISESLYDKFSGKSRLYYITDVY